MGNEAFMGDQASAEQIELVPFRAEFGPAFERLNREWLERFELLEAGDLPYLIDPQGTIVDKGGAVLCALHRGQVIGTVCVIRQSAQIFELAKLAVNASARGRGIGRRLTKAAIEFASSAGAELLVLSSNHQLVEAIKLYESLGFTHSAPSGTGVAYATADVFMQLPLGATRNTDSESTNPSLQGSPP